MLKQNEEIWYDNNTLAICVKNLNDGKYGYYGEFGNNINHLRLICYEKTKLGWQELDDLNMISNLTTEFNEKDLFNIIKNHHESLYNLYKLRYSLYPLFKKICNIQY